MHIGINTLFYIPGQVGGTETYLLEVLRRFEQEASQHSVTLFTQLENDELLRNEFSRLGWSFSLCPFRAENRYARIVREQTELPWRARQARIDVLWSPGYTLPILSACPQVVTIHDMQYKSFPEDLSTIARFTTDALVHMAARPHRHIIAVSEFSRQEILKHTRANADRVHVTLEAVSSTFRSDLEGTESTPDAPYILCVANTYPHKRVEDLVTAFACLEKSIPHNLVLVGRPRRGEAAVQNALLSLSDKTRCIRKEGLTRKQLVQLYRHAAAFVFPSHYEGFGLPVLEALCAGTPVVTTRCASIPEVGGDAVAYYDHKDPSALASCLLQVLNRHEDERVLWKQKAEKQIALFNWNNTARETIAVLAKAANA
jgi:glycosyltransferase involved in cell wall biosynthesis